MSDCVKINCPTCNLEIEENFLEQKCPRCQTIIESKIACGSCHSCVDSLPSAKSLLYIENKRDSF